MKTDKLFYKMLLTQPEAVAELLSGIPKGCVFDYKAPVVKEKEFRLDGVLLPLSEDMTIPLVFFEAQMQSDGGFYGRYFAELHLYLSQYRVERPWLGLLILQSRGQILGSEVPHRTLLRLNVTRIYLEDLLPLKNLSPNLALLRLIVVPEEDLGVEGRAILAAAEGETDFRRQLDMVEGIMASKFPQLTVEEVRQMLGLTSVDFTETMYYKQVSQISVVKHTLQVLSRRFGALPIAQQDQVRSMSSEQLDRLGDAMFDFEGLEDVERWLGENVV
jgi:predicted transposase YdaD